VRKMIPRRPADAHKGRNGHVLAIAGSRGMSGAAFLVGLGALRSGAGLVTVAMPEGELASVTSQLPEALTLPLPEAAEGRLADRAWDVLEAYRKSRTITALALGPGLSVHESVAQILKAILKEWDLPAVLDADGLNNTTPRDLQARSKTVIT